ncbi:MAG TPA: XdhC/CoxI family protein [Ktedonobacterales bacterium]|nr:XdhC/CoxI family protein [Ktedonobacterales bacterium]
MFDEIANALAHGQAVALLTVVRVNGATPCPPGTKLLAHEDGELVGSLRAASLDNRAREDGQRLLRSGQSELVIYHLDPDSGESVGSCGATIEVFIEPLRPEPRLLIAGSGYVAQALARLAAPLGWRVALVDDRSEFAASAALPDRAEVAVADIAAWLRERRTDAMSAIVIVTRGHRSDEEALRAALESNAGYVGMIGSPSKVRAIFRRLLRSGTSRTVLERVHAPIGLDLGSETPDEIALSIAAELLLWRRGGTGQRLRDTASVLERLTASAIAQPDAEEAAEAVEEAQPVTPHASVEANARA